MIECLPRQNDFRARVVNLPCCIVLFKALIYVYVRKGSAEKIFAQRHLAVFVFFYLFPNLFDWSSFCLSVSVVCYLANKKGARVLLHILDIWKRIRDFIVK